ncbi:DDE-type integrase/transposase/recombinase [Turicibacter sanguinis]|uniref:DDE-type integrase/transposase/recombinase n=2 Tax=Turicibacter sanguinis TaxID=154288 RepID=A0A9X4XFB3_9FIRM|nr:DDE-type integrase/transposase/recombinase [Turicibacter sanguinis]MTK73056.1 DDE-type integrase/transposase/recombinase [Turicibacter sanguinis]QJS20455.1 DDE-type integrase/transposase/recombinase [Turicibacter sanguinis]
MIQKKYPPYKQAKEFGLQRHNILEQDCSTTSINQKWVSDITYIYVHKEGWCYLASVMDLHSKKIIGYHFSKQMTKDLIVQGLKNAYFSQRPKDKVILHTDLGTQYTNQDFKNLTFLCPKYLPRSTLLRFYIFIVNYFKVIYNDGRKIETTNTIKILSKPFITFSYKSNLAEVINHTQTIIIEDELLNLTFILLTKQYLFSCNKNLLT